MILNIKFHEILLISFLTTFATKFLSHTHRQTFSKNSQIVSGHLKACNTIKNRKSEICTKPILSSTYIDESKKKTMRKKNNFLSKTIETIFLLSLKED